MRYFLVLVLICGASATTIPVEVLGVTNRQAIIRYTAPDSGACTVTAAPVNTNFVPEVAQLDTTLFGASADSDSTLTVKSYGLTRTLIIGLAASATALNGWSYSLANAAGESYTGTVSCDSGTNTGSFGFTTDNTLLGDSSPPSFPYDSAQWGAWSWPTIDFSYAGMSTSYIDPQTGAVLFRLTGPGQDSGSSTGSLANFCPNPTPGIVDEASAWVTPQNIGCSPDGNYASYNGSAGSSAALFISPNVLYGYGRSGRPSYQPQAFGSYDDLQAVFHAYGSDASEVLALCISADFGSTCPGGNEIDYTLPTTGTTISLPSSYPNPMFKSWGTPPPNITPDMLMNQFSGHISTVTENTGGTTSTVTWGSNSNSSWCSQSPCNLYFPVTALTAGKSVIQIAGTDPICPQNICPISSITDEQHLVIGVGIPSWSPTVMTTLVGNISAGATSVTVAATNGFVPLNIYQNTQYHLTIGTDSINCLTISGFSSSGGTLSGCNGVNNAHTSGASVGEDVYNFPNFGIKLWKKSGSGTVYIDSLNFNLASSAHFFTNDEGGAADCSTATVAVNYTATGGSLSPTEYGYTCVFQSEEGNYSMYLFIPPSTSGNPNQTPESRQIVNLGSSTLNRDGSDPLDFYSFNSSTGIESACSYSVSLGHWRSTAPYGNGGAVGSAWTCTAITTNVTTEVASACGTSGSSVCGGLGINTSYFGNALQAGILSCPSGHSVSPCLFLFWFRPNQNAMSWFCTFDLAQPSGAGQVQLCDNSWSSYPIRFNGNHGGWGGYGPGTYTLATPLAPLNAQGVYAQERYDIPLNSIYNNGGTTALTSTFVDPSSCQTMVTAAGGGTIPSYLGTQIPGWTGTDANDCIRINTNQNYPAASSPNSGDITAPGTWPTGSFPMACSFDSSKACLQPTAAGDWWADAGQGNGNEQFMVLYGHQITGGTWDYILARHMGSACNGGSSVHGSGWTPYASSTQTCSGTVAWVQPTLTAISQSSTLFEYGYLFTSHQTAYTTTSNVNVHISPVSWNTQSPSFPSDQGGYWGGYAIRNGAFPGVIGQTPNYGVQELYGYGAPGHGQNFTGVSTVQWHPGAGYRSGNWAVDGRPFGGAGGGLPFLWYQTPTLVTGQTHTWSLGNCFQASTSNCELPDASWPSAPTSPKLTSLFAFSGQHNLKDISGPSSSISDSTPWSSCTAYAANECVPGSIQYQVYVSVPEGDTSGTCSSDLSVYWLCAVPSYPVVSFYTQYEVDTPDSPGQFYRRLTTLMNGPGRTNNYANAFVGPTGDYNVAATTYGNGERGDLFAIFLNQFPQHDSIGRNHFEPVAVRIPAATGKTARIRFGYNSSLYCASRQEQCMVPAANSSDPYAWLSESPTWTSCSSGTDCEIDIPAISQSVLYYVVDTQVGGVTTSYPIEIVATK